MYLTGRYVHTLDAKNRVAVPSELRQRLDPERHGVGFYVGPGPNGAVWVWPAKAFDQFVRSLATDDSIPEDEVMEFEQHLFSESSYVELDAAGRIRLSDRLLEVGGLGKEILILGVRDHMELQDPERHDARRRERLEHHTDMLADARKAYQRARRSAGANDAGGTD